jgi:hypothetical protein
MRQLNSWVKRCRTKSLAFVIEISRKLSLGIFPEILAITSDQVKLLRIGLGDQVSLSKVDDAAKQCA